MLSAPKWLLRNVRLSALTVSQLQLPHAFLQVWPLAVEVLLQGKSTFLMYFLAWSFYFEIETPAVIINLK